MAAAATLLTETPAVPPPDTPAPAPSTDALYEVVGTDYVEKSPMGAFEYELANLLAQAMKDFAAPGGLGRALVEMLFDLRPAVDRDRRPDAAFLSDARWPVGRRAPRTAAWRVVPDLAVEVVSPTNPAAEVRGKVEEYFQAGVRLVWVVYPDQRLVDAHDSPRSVRVARDGDDLDGGAVLPGFRLAVTDLFGPADE